MYVVTEVLQVTVLKETITLGVKKENVKFVFPQVTHEVLIRASTSRPGDPSPRTRNNIKVDSVNDWCKKHRLYAGAYCVQSSDSEWRKRRDVVANTLA